MNGNNASARIPDGQQANSTISSSAYARKSKAILDLDRELHALGASMLVDLPRIAVIGGQSAGKSSLVEAVSGINVPRDSGTCTRCPMECTMSSSATAWSCAISLQLRYDVSGNELATEMNTRFGPLITNKSEVELWIRRAQAAMLCPHRKPSEFMNKSEGELKEALNVQNDPRVLQFSKNVVLIDVKDPELTDLSFIDLPGLIQNAEPAMIDLVKNLVVSHIQGANTLILTIIPVSDDMDNQQAARLAREADPQGERTIGVLTKPDTLPDGATGQQSRWMQVLQGQAYTLKHGYYCVRLPSDAERAEGVSKANSEQLSSTFFDTKAPWKDVPDRRKLGIPNFVSDISLLLVDLIEKNLPTLRENIEKLLLQCTGLLDKLPPPPINEPSTEILLRITSFCNDIKSTASADINKNITQAHRHRYSQFKDDIKVTTPDFRACPDCTQGYTVPEERGITFITDPKDLKFVRKVIQESIGWELPGHVPFEATKRLVLMYTTLWEKPAFSCFEDIFATTVTFIMEQLSKHFGYFHALQRYIKELVDPVLTECKSKCLERLRATLALETVPLYTQNTHYLESAEKKWVTSYCHTREYPPRPPGPIEVVSTECYVDSGFTAPRAKSIYSLQKDEYREEVIVDSGFTAPRAKSIYSLQKDEYREEIIVMAKSRAYFQVAYKRIIDYVPLTIEHGLNQSLASVIQQTLFSTILKDGNDSQKMAKLLQEDPTISSERKRLEERKACLLQIKRKLDQFRGSEEL